MKLQRQAVLFAFAIFALLLHLGGNVQSVQAAASACSLATVRGSYEFVAPATLNLGGGTVIAIPDEYIYASPAAFASKGSLIFSGNQRVILNALERDGVAFASPERMYGNFIVQANCTATVTFANETHLNLKLVKNGAKQVLVSTTPGFVVLPSH